MAAAMEAAVVTAEGEAVGGLVSAKSDQHVRCFFLHPIQRYVIDLIRLELMLFATSFKGKKSTESMSYVFLASSLGDWWSSVRIRLPRPNYYPATSRNIR